MESLEITALRYPNRFGLVHSIVSYRLVSLERWTMLFQLGEDNDWVAKAIHPSLSAIGTTLRLGHRILVNANTVMKGSIHYQLDASAILKLVLLYALTKLRL